MGYNVKYQISDQERKALLSLIKARNSYNEEGEAVLTLEAFAKDALIAAANKMYALLTGGRSESRSDEPVLTQNEERSEGHGTAPSEQQQGQDDSAGNVPAE
jgi:hypothetical protein